MAKFLFDMLDSARAISRYSDGKTYADFEADRLLREAVYWNFVVIGEALARIRRLDEAVAERFTEWDQIIGFRNRVVHGYDVLLHDTTWKIITTKLPILIAEIESIIPPLPSPPAP